MLFDLTTNLKMLHFYEGLAEFFLGVKREVRFVSVNVYADITQSLDATLPQSHG